jgi:hypothetical protein
MNLFRSEEHVKRWLGEREPGATIAVATLCELAHRWWGDRLSPDWQPRVRAESQRILSELGLTGLFWELPIPVGEIEAVFVDRVNRFALEMHRESGRTFVSFPVSNPYADYTEWYEVDRTTFDRYVADPTRAHRFVEQAKNRELDHLLLLKPGRLRGEP